jgi:FAD/FMN-containing dehydrogenase
MGRIFLFFTAIILSGGAALGGSIAGNAVGKTGLWVGGIVGGLVGASISSWLAAKLGWIAPSQRARTTIGTATGFLLAAGIAVNTLSSPVGPIASTVLAGLGAVIGAGSKKRDDE